MQHNSHLDYNCGGPCTWAAWRCCQMAQVRTRCFSQKTGGTAWAYLDNQPCCYLSSPSAGRCSGAHCAVWTTPTVFCPWHQQLEKNGRAAPAFPQWAPQSRAENSVLSRGETQNLFQLSLGLTGFLEILSKYNSGKRLKCRILNQEAWAAQANCLPMKMEV